MNQKLVLPDSKGNIVISSILAHLDSYFGTKGYMDISANLKQLYTSSVNVIAGELFWS